MATKPASVGSLKVGSYVVLDGAACRVKNIDVSRPGKHGHAKVRLEGVGLVDEKKRVIAWFKAKNQIYIFAFCS